MLFVVECLVCNYDREVDMATNGTIEPVQTTLSSQEQEPGKYEVGKDLATRLNDTANSKESDVALKARDWTGHILEFLSNASNETLGACIIGLGATTYFILGRVGLVIIGLVGGVVLHATWEEKTQYHANDDARATEARKGREKGLAIISRVLDWREKSKTIENDASADLTNSIFEKELDFSGFQPETKDALQSFTDAIIRDYVGWWYSPILPNDVSFPFASRQTLTRFFLVLSTHLSRKRPADTFLDFLTNSSAISLVFLKELSGALKNSPGVESSDAIHHYIEENPDCSLANVLDAGQQNKKLKVISEDILQSFLEPSAYRCEPVKVFLREVLAGLILEMTITSCSRPEFINEWIIYALEEGETTELVQAIDAGVSSATFNGNINISVHTTKMNESQISEHSHQQPEPQTQAAVEHKRTVSRAEDAMEEAMQEAKRLSELIAAEEAKRVRSSEEISSFGGDTAVVETPASSPSDLATFTNHSTDAPPEVEGAQSMPRFSQAAETPPSLTTFDQIISSQPTAPQASAAPLLSSQPPLTLYNASVSIFDDSLPGEKGVIRTKPTADYLLQIEPATSQHPGWMISRKYPDFETLHEVLRRISVVSGIVGFAEKHHNIPTWKSNTKAALRTDLEQYLRDALSFQRLAESEGMKRFLEKDQGLGQSSPSTNKGGFGFPSPAAFENMGKGMLDVLASAPKGAAGGGKAILGGVTGVLGGVGSIGQKKQATNGSAGRGLKSASSSTATLPYIDSPTKSGSQESPRFSSNTAQASPRQSSTSSREAIKPPPLPKRPSHGITEQHDGDIEVQSGANSYNQEAQTDDLRKPFVQSPVLKQDELHLPPPPSEITDDYGVVQASPKPSLDDSATLRTSTSSIPTTYSPSRKSTISPLPPTDSNPMPSTRSTPPPLTVEETSVAVELFFATINELYSLSSAWTLRLTLLNAAKSFLLRPGNPNLEAIRQLLQSTMIDANTSDAGIAVHIEKVRENALPTEEELKAWPPGPSEEEKENRRRKARKLLVEKGMPQALTSVMGAAASGEALGKVFDCLQVPDVARGLVFALVLQGVKAVTQ